jgi:hypothetical protein
MTFKGRASICISFAAGLPSSQRITDTISEDPFCPTQQGLT